MRAVLITGGLGFIGRAVACLLVDQGRPVVLLDSLNSQIHGDVPDLASLALLKHPLVRVVRGSVRDPEIWDKTLPDVDSVIHLAAETGTAQSMYEISRYTDVNVGGTALLLHYLANRKHAVRKLVLASSRSVYGEGAYSCARCGIVYPPMRCESMFSVAQWDPFCPKCTGAISPVATSEDGRTAPASIYAATKLAQEDLVRIASRALGIPHVVFRFQNVYGEGQSLKNPYTGILSIFSMQLRRGQALNLYEDSHESRDFVHVTDVARAVVLGLLSDRGDGCTLNVGSGRPTTVRQIATLLRERIQCDAEPFTSGQYRLGDIRHGYADLSSIASKLGFAPQISLESGLDRFVAWVLTQPVEPDRLPIATRELVERGLMAGVQ